MRKFTPEEDEFLKQNYLTIPCKRMSKMLGRAEVSARQRLKLLGYVVPPEVAANFRRGTQFKKGEPAHNKGQKMSPEMYEKVKATMFKPGHITHNTKYDGHERLSKDGYIEVRVSKGRYKLKHRKIWEDSFGKVPAGHVVIFKDNNRQNCDINNLELITRKENMIRNKTLPNYPRELQKVEYLRTQLKSKIKNHGKK